MPSGTLHSISVAAVVVDTAGRVLVIQRRDNGKWEPPGGVLESGESIIDGLQREVYEETGLWIEPDRLTGVYKNLPRDVVALVFRAHVHSGELRSTTETVQAQWWERNTIVSRLDEAYAIRVLDALDTTEPAVRAHDGVRLTNDAPSLPPHTLTSH